MTNAVSAESDRAELSPVSLVARAQAGDYRAFDALLEVRIARLLRIAEAIIGNEPDARDATQEACVSAWRELPALRDVERFDAWLGRILTNACRTSLRTRRRRAVRELRITTLDTLMDMDAALTTESPADIVGGGDALTRAFDRLGPDARAVLVLHHLEGRSVAEIAAILGVPRPTVKWRLYVARGSLRRAMEVEDR